MHACVSMDVSRDDEIIKALLTSYNLLKKFEVAHLDHILHIAHLSVAKLQAQQTRLRRSKLCSFYSLVPCLLWKDSRLIPTS